MRVYFILTALLCSQILLAQEVKQLINSIKQNNAYMNAESTEDTMEDAFNMALEELVNEANIKFATDIPVAEAKKVSKYYEIKRGESIRVFVYALVSDISKLANGNSYSETSNTPVQQPVISVPIQMIRTDNSQLNAVSEIFSRMNTLSEIKSLLREYKQDGKIQDYNWITSMNIQQDAHIVIFRDEVIVGVLLGEKNGQRINILNSNEDSIVNYSKCRAIWYK